LESAAESTTAEETESSTTAAATGAGAATGVASTATSASDFLEVLGALFLTRVLGISILYNGK
jgi:hypothetical protein